MLPVKDHKDFRKTKRDTDRQRSEILFWRSGYQPLLYARSRLILPYCMPWNDEEIQIHYKVVVNHEEQYSIWPSGKQNPEGWRDAGKIGNEAECLQYIEEVWKDMRPLSLRKQMEM